MLIIRWKYNYVKHIITNRKTYSFFLSHQKYRDEGLITDTNKNHDNTLGIL